MSPDSQPSSKDRRNYFRMTSLVPLSVKIETNAQEAVFSEQPVNLSGGGIGFVSSTSYNPGDILVLALRLTDQVTLTSRAEVLRLTPIPHKDQSYRVHARFVGMAERDRELLIRHIMRLQRDHLHEHYST
jgi:c-di-GMP-binding flagellar brake protein YcgR